MKNAKIILIALACILMLVIVFQNTAPVETKLLFVTVTMPRAVLLAVLGGMGFVAGLLTAASMGRKKKPSA
jgi:uncharacterized integral membrane protein